MSSKTVRIVIWGSVAVAVVVVSYLRFGTNFRLQIGNQQNELINDANALIDEGDATKRKLGSNVELLIGGAVPQELASDRAKLEETVDKANVLLTKVVESYRAAAAKFDAGSKLGLSSVVSKYLELKSTAYTNLADAEEANRKILLLLVDKPVPTGDELKKKQDALAKQFFTCNSEFERLDMEAEKLHDENKSKFN